MNDEGKKPAIGRREWYLIGAVLLAALALFFANRRIFSGPSAAVEITVDGKIYRTLDLGTDQEITIPGAGGGSNHLVIRDGEVWIDDASCPDKTCMHQGRKSRDGQMLVCLPNLVIAKITGG